MNIVKYDFSELIEDRNKKLVLVIYDIVDNKRRMKMVKLLESYGSRVQKSAFEVLITDMQEREIKKKIEKIIDPEDNVRLYRLNSSNEVTLFGSSDTAYSDEVIII